MEFKNDLGKPWKYEEGDFTVVRTSMWSPPGCHPVGCGLKLYVDKEGRLDHVEGDENNPITKGRLCVRCLALKDYVYNPSRIVVPLKRDPQFRGQHDKWERISWEEAYETIRDNVVRLVEEHGAECIVGLNGTGRSGRHHFERPRSRHAWAARTRPRRFRASPATSRGRWHAAAFWEPTIPRSTMPAGWRGRTTTRPTPSRK